MCLPFLMNFDQRTFVGGCCGEKYFGWLYETRVQTRSRNTIKIKTQKCHIASSKLQSCCRFYLLQQLLQTIGFNCSVVFKRHPIGLTNVVGLTLYNHLCIILYTRRLFICGCQSYSINVIYLGMTIETVTHRGVLGGIRGYTPSTNLPFILPAYTHLSCCI